jgi:hypothetical protein
MKNVSSLAEFQSTSLDIIYLILTSILASIVRVGVVSDLLPSSFPNDTVRPFLISIRVTCPAQHMFLHFISLKIGQFGEGYKLSSFPLCAFLNFPGTPCFFGPNILSYAVA